MTAHVLDCDDPVTVKASASELEKNPYIDNGAFKSIETSATNQMSDDDRNRDWRMWTQVLQTPVVTSSNSYRDFILDK